MSSDRITLRGLRAFGFHGVLAEERRDGQVFVVDVVLVLDTAPAGRSDRLADTVDYAALAAAVRALVEGEPVDLIERLAERIAAAALADERVAQVEVTVHKPAAPVPAVVDDVSVSITRARQ
ncbi:MAG: dihydroneopterin aldolase [Actinomycetota bacterium]|nr:dihydroneopterin aldolase [Actinomycetota bacterium]